MYTDDQIFGLLRTYIKKKALLTASIASGSEEKRDTGLVAGHAYSILDAKRFNKGKQTLLKLRNPWGRLGPNPNPNPDPNPDPDPNPNPNPNPYPNPYPKPNSEPNPHPTHSQEMPARVQRA